MADTSQDKNLPASPRKLRKAREEGQVARSRDLGHFMVMLGCLGLMAGLAPWAIEWLRQGIGSALRFDHHVLESAATMHERLSVFTLYLLWLVLPLSLLVIFMSMASNLLASGWVWSSKAMAPKFERINPLAGLKRMVSPQQLMQAAKNALLALVLLTIGGFFLYKHFEEFASMMGLPLYQALAQIGYLLLRAFGYLVVALALFASIDLPLQHFLHKRKLRMSRQEVKDEVKQMEGNQETKARARARMREMSHRRSLAAVPAASAVVMNPTHYAVAIKYEEGMNAPRVVAMGADLLALRIREIALASQVPVLQAPALARALYTHAELDQEIPMALYTAVAQVMAYVFQLRATLSRRGGRRLHAPNPQVPPELDPETPEGKGRPPIGRNKRRR